MNILISGGSGFLGSAFSEWVTANHQAKISGITWLTRNTSQSHPNYVSLMSYDELKTTAQTFDVIINLAGAGIADKRWSDERKKTLYSSRINPTKALIEFIERIEQKPKLLVSGSAIGWYGPQGDAPLTETSQAVNDFAHQLCQRWEEEASKAANLGVPVAIVRTGIVIHPDGGMIDRLLTPFKLGMGGQLGDGRQIMSWISREDWIRAVWFIIQLYLQQADSAKKDKMPSAAVFNLTAPNPVSNKQFTKALGKWLHRPTFMTMPAPVLKMMFGEMSTLLLDGQKVLPQALEKLGFKFAQPQLMQALSNQQI